MAAVSDGGRLTLAEYLAAPETNRRRELTWGIVREPPAPTWGHQFVLARLFRVLDAHVCRFGLGQVGLAPIDVILDPEQDLVVQPDLVFIPSERSGIVRDRVWGAPDLVVEVLSPDSRRYDREQKRSWYAQYGVRELWLVDPRAGSIAVCDLSKPENNPTIYAGAQLLRSQVLPRLRFRVSSAFP